MADMVFAWHRGVAVTVEAFRAEAHALAARLPGHPYVVNLCEDRYAFVVGFAGALIARQTTLLPPSRAPQAVEDSCAGRDAYRLTDEDVLQPGPAASAGSSFSFDHNHVAAIVFTSGSTGRPAPQGKTWGSLAAGARAFASLFGVRAPACVLGTIPPQHMFGLESTVMLPWQNDLAIHSGRPLLPSDIEAAIAAPIAPWWLMTSPLHLRACVSARQALPGLAGVVSSTMPLDRELACEAEALWQVPVHEIYGSSEAGIIAARRPAADATWQLCPGVELFEREGVRWVRGGHILEAQRIADELEPCGERRFLLHGRSASLVKIAGKRTTLEALNAALARVHGVHDGVFYQREGAARLGALVVAPGCSARGVRAALRRYIDPAFLPRPLHLVDALPRNESGKLGRQALLDFVASLDSETAS
jgi:acyl-coenzyme A synthetase/AMP-(fatty) acid ligase